MLENELAIGRRDSLRGRWREDETGEALLDTQLADIAEADKLHPAALFRIALLEILSKIEPT